MLRKLIALCLALLLAGATYAATVVLIKKSSTYAQDSRNFDGTDDQIVLGCTDSGSANGEGGDSTYTQCAWVKTPTISTGTHAIYTEGDTASTSSNASLELSSTGKVTCTRRTGGTVNNATGTVDVDDDAWHYVCCVASGTGGGTITPWVDGTADGAGTSLTAAAATFEHCAAGVLRRSTFATPTTVDFYGGSIAHIQVWSVAVAESVIDNSMLTPGCETTSLVHYWPLRGESPEVDYAPSGAYDSTSIVGTTVTSAQSASITSDCEN